MPEELFSIASNRELITGLIDVISKATACSEFKTICTTNFLDRGLFPPEVLDHWYLASRNDKAAFNHQFLQKAQSVLKKVLEQGLKMDASKLDTSKYESCGDFVGPKHTWDPQDETGNPVDKDVDILDYFESISTKTDFNFEALTSQFAFDQNSRQLNSKYALVPLAMQPINTRPVSVNWVTNQKNWDGRGQYKMFEYVSSHPATMNERDKDRMKGNQLYVILAKRQRRDQVNHPLKHKLSSATPTWPIQTTENFTATRETGVKVVGDHVSVACDFQAVADLFEALTVSPKSQKFNFVFRDF